MAAPTQDWAAGLDFQPDTTPAAKSESWANGLDFTPDAAVQELSPLQQALRVGQTPEAPPETGAAVLKEIGSGLAREGRTVRGVAQDIARIPAGIAFPEQDTNPIWQNTVAGAQLVKQTPFDVETAGDKGWMARTSRAAGNLAEMAPALLLSHAAGPVVSLGGKTWQTLAGAAAAGTVFGFNEEGFDPVQGALMALAPGASKLGQMMGMKTLSKVLPQVAGAPESVVKALESTFSFLGMQAYFDALSEPEYVKAYKENPEKFWDLWSEKFLLNAALHLPAAANVGGTAIKDVVEAKRFKDAWKDIANAKAIIGMSASVPEGFGRAGPASLSGLGQNRTSDSIAGGIIPGGQVGGYSFDETTPRGKSRRFESGTAESAAAKQDKFNQENYDAWRTNPERARENQFETDAWKSLGLTLGTQEQVDRANELLKKARGLEPLSEEDQADLEKLHNFVTDYVTARRDEHARLVNKHELPSRRYGPKPLTPTPNAIQIQSAIPLGAEEQPATVQTVAEGSAGGIVEAPRTRPAEETPGTTPAVAPVRAEAVQSAVPQVGSTLRIANTDSTLTDARTDENGIRYELFSNRKVGEKSTVRVTDVDSGNVVSITQYPTYGHAEDAFKKASAVAATPTTVETPVGAKNAQTGKPSGNEIASPPEIASKTSGLVETPAPTEVPAVRGNEAVLGRTAETGAKAAKKESALTPMMQQYQKIKAQLVAEGHDALLAYRLGDFYEFFFDDASKAAKLLNITLTNRNGTPMAGIPYHAADSYFGKLVSAGQKVAVVDTPPEGSRIPAGDRRVTEIRQPATPAVTPAASPPPVEISRPIAEKDIIARSPVKERADINNGTRQIEYRVRKVSDAERNARWETYGQTPWAVESRLVLKDLDTGKTETNEWQAFARGETRQKAIEDGLGDTSFQNATPEDSTFKKVTEKAKALRDWQANKAARLQKAIQEAKWAGEKAVQIRDEANKKYSTALKRAKIYDQAQAGKADPAKVKAIQEKLFPTYRPLLDKAKADMVAADAKVNSIEQEKYSPSMTPEGRVEAAFLHGERQGVVAPETPESRHAALTWHEIAGHGGLESVARENTRDGEEMRTALEASIPFLEREKDALAQAGGYDNAEKLAEKYGFDVTDPTQIGSAAGQGRQAYYFELMSRKAEELAGKPKPSWWRDLLGRIQVWFAKKFGVRLSENGVEALIRSGMRDMQGQELQVRAIPTADGMDISFSQKSADTLKNYEDLTAFAPDMPKRDADFNRKVHVLENFASVPVRAVAEFPRLPPEVVAELPQIENRLEVAAKATRDLQGVAPARQSLRDMALNSSAETPEQQKTMMAGAISIARMVDSETALQDKVDTSTKQLDSLRKTESARNQAIPQAEAVLTDYRKNLTAQRQVAEAAGNTPLVDAIDKTVGKLANYESSVATVLTDMVKRIPPALLGPGYGPADVRNWLMGNPKGTFSAETAQIIGQTPDIIPRLRIVAGLDSPPSIVAAETALAHQRAALDFLQQKVLRDPEFRANYEQAVEWMGGLGIRQEKGTNPYYVNPYDPSESREIVPDLDQAAWEQNQRAFADVRNWYERYVKDPNADPLKREGFKHQLQQIDMLANQSFEPALGKLSPSAKFDPMYALVRATAGVMDIPEHVLELIGGRMAHETYLEVVNYSAVGERMQQVHERLRAGMQKATYDAGFAAGFKGNPNQIVHQWQRDIGNRILASYQTRGDVRLKAGMPVNGHVITKADMAAVDAQKAYVDGVLEAQKSMREGPAATTQGIYSPTKIVEHVGGLTFHREAKDISGKTVPQKLAQETRTIVDAWMDPKTDRTALLNKAGNWPWFMSHVESFGNPDYRSFVKSPFFREYLDMDADIQKGVQPEPKSLDELANELFRRLGKNINLRTMSVDEIKAQFVDEIDHVIRAHEMERAEQPKLVTDAPNVSVVSAENFMNRPRGERLLPWRAYDYTVGTEEQMAAIRTAAKEIYGARLLKSANSLRDALATKETELRSAIEKGFATSKTSLQAVQDGTSLVHLKEIERLKPQLNRFITDFETAKRRQSEDEKDLYSGVNVARGWLSNLLIGRLESLWRNAAGLPMNAALQDREMLSAGRNMFYRLPLVHPIAATTKAAFRLGQSFVTTSIGQLGKTERGRKIRAALATNRTMLGAWGGDIAQYIDRQAARVEEMERLGIITPGRAAERIAANWDFMQQRGRITSDLENVGKLRRFGRSLVSLMDIGQEIGLPIAQIPRSLASPLVDNAINATARVRVQDMLDTLHMNAVGALDIRQQFGPIDPRTAVLTPQEVFGLTGKSNAEMHRALTAARQEFAKAGISLDRYLVEHWQAVKRAPGTDPQVLTDAQMNALQFEQATRMNKGVPKNRPMYHSNASKLAMTFLGYGIWQNARLSQNLAGWSRDARRIDPGSLSRAAHVVGTIAVVGSLMAYLPAKWIANFFFNEEKPVKDLWETDNAGEFALTVLRQSYGVLPVVGNVLNYALGSVTGAGANGGFSLLPVSLATSVSNVINKGLRTGEWDRPIMEFIRQWMPNSRIVLNRLPMREGMTNEGAMRAALAANAPKGVEVKAFNAGATRQYSVVSGQLDNVINALSRDGGPDLTTVASERQAGIDRLVRLTGVTPDAAARTFDLAVLAREPYKATYGRDLTTEENQSLRSHLNSTQQRILDTVEGGRQAYASQYGLGVPDFVKDAPGTRGGAFGGSTAQTRASGYGGSTASRSGGSRASLRGLGLRSGIPSAIRSPRQRRFRLAAPRSGGVRSRRYGTTRRNSRRIRV